jgi:DNA polymerase-1
MITKDTPKKLFLLDAFALIYRAYFAFSSNPRVSSKGLNTSAIFGFTNTLLEILNKEKPTHIAVVFDTPEPTIRHTEFVEYKAQREEMPDDLRKCIPYIFQLVEGFNIPVIKTPGFEADDAIGTLAKIAEQQGFTTYMMTPDKDYGQLVDDNTFIYKPARLGNGAEILGVPEICKKWEITHVGQLIDILGLMGDKADNIPGIPGVGEKTAIQLVKDFGTIENLYLNTDKLKGKLKEKVENNKEQAMQSKWLATIILDVPVEFNENELTLKEINKEALRELFTELEFRGIAQKLLGEDIGGAKEATNFAAKVKEAPKAKPDLFSSGDMFSDENIGAVAEADSKVFKTFKDINPNYILCDTKEKIAQLISVLNNHTGFCFDTETTDLNTLNAEIVGLSFAVKSKEAYYVPISEDNGLALHTINLFKPLFEDKTKTLIGQNIKYDLQVLKNYGVVIHNKLWDTMVAHFLFMPDMRHNMNILAETYLDYQPISIEELIGKKGKDQLSMRSVPIDIITNYAAEDADITFQLKEAFEPKLKEAGTEKLFHEVELPLIEALAGMEREGINIDVAGLNEFSTQLKDDIAKVDAEIQ